jgi:hypothetical protein
MVMPSETPPYIGEPQKVGVERVTKAADDKLVISGRFVDGI